ncbi:hypothetical protein [Sphingorhabdus sp.]|uniref:hypothetical protein n=1 Tax=Sphingorhabdus sp. TaxID=1902408 RepID=UPI003BAF4B7B|nr:hypothetical protein [Sphingomonadales bacterium]MBK9431230.1 hypothetical protein [Sphingomonadales bacterium]MBL0021361.1 hypothetical protein [Sphingomonadales bacterium]
MTSRPVWQSYSVNGHDEGVMRLGIGHARQILIVPPLFDEANRTRRMLVQTMRFLDQACVGSLLIDLPGCNESRQGLQQQSLDNWRHAVRECAGQCAATHIVSLRGGSLVDDGEADLPHWRLAPAKGASLLKTMIRTRIAGDKEAGKATTEAELLEAAKASPIELAGNLLAPDMVAQLAAAEARELPVLTVRALGQGIIGSPLWLRAEPQDDPAMSAAIATDFAAWSASCGG